MKKLTKFKKEVKASSVFRTTFGPGNPNNRKFHIRAVVDDQVVLRTWISPSVRWAYTIMSVTGIWIYVSRGHGELS